MPEYKAVKEARDAIQADAEASKIFADYIAFQHEIQIMAQTGQIPDASFQEKNGKFWQADSRELSLVRILCQTATTFDLPF